MGCFFVLPFSLLDRQYVNSLHKSNRAYMQQMVMVEITAWYQVLNWYLDGFIEASVETLKQ